MSNIWCVHSSWGSHGPNVLDLFFDYGCVFFGHEDDCHHIGHWRDIRKDDLFIVTDGQRALALGIALQDYKDNDNSINMRQADIDDYVYGCQSFKYCPAKLEWIPDDKRFSVSGSIGRFHKVNAWDVVEKARSVWAELNADSERNKFKISTRVSTILESDDKDEPIFRPNVRYHVPIYQRPYSWGYNEIRRLVEDLKQGLDDDEAMFLGTLQLSNPVSLDASGKLLSYEVIDGQQRLSTFMILLILLGKILKQDDLLNYFRNSFRSSVNKRAAQQDLHDFFEYVKSFDVAQGRGADSLAYLDGSNVYVKNCLVIFDLLREFSLDGDDVHNQDEGLALLKFAQRLWPFVCCKVKIVVIETLAGINKTLKIFNTINTAGMPLGVDDLFKLNFYEYLRKRNAPESVFDDISAVYERIANYNKDKGHFYSISMGDVLSAYQRIVIAKNNLGGETFWLSYSRFFNMLTETDLGLQKCAAFSNMTQDLSVEDLNKVVDCYVQYNEACSSNNDLKIFREMIWETRYGMAWNYPIVALFFGTTDVARLPNFLMGLVKGLVPQSLRWSRAINGQKNYLVAMLRDLSNGTINIETNIAQYCFDRWNMYGESLERALDVGLGNVIVWVPKWKKLLCILAEYLLTPTESRDSHLYNRLFRFEYDIEHIQPYTDEKDRDRIWNEWGDELNKLGNLALFERNLNRAVKNHPDKKAVVYGQSNYFSINLLKDDVLNWTKEKAEARRNQLTLAIKKFLKE